MSAFGDTVLFAGEALIEADQENAEALARRAGRGSVRRTRAVALAVAANGPLGCRPTKKSFATRATVRS